MGGVISKYWVTFFVKKAFLRAYGAGAARGETAVGAFRESRTDAKEAGTADRCTAVVPASAPCAVSFI